MAQIASLSTTVQQVGIAVSFLLDVCCFAASFSRWIGRDTKHWMHALHRVMLSCESHRICPLLQIAVAVQQIQIDQTQMQQVSVRLDSSTSLCCCRRRRPPPLMVVLMLLLQINCCTAYVRRLTLVMPSHVHLHSCLRRRGAPQRGPVAARPRAPAPPPSQPSQHLAARR